ncbi:MAG: hypothetical protein NT118_10445 [Lentisphaerae bacterium]|nr:hypothetical protein [Lentisphaerota bacterium]
MTRPLIGEFALDETFNCKLSETESSMLDSLAYTTGFTKSEVVRLFIRYAYVMLSDLAYQVQKEAEKANEKLSMAEHSKRIRAKLEDEYQKFFQHDNLEEEDYLMMTIGDIPVKMSGKFFVMDKRQKKKIAARNEYLKTIMPNENKKEDKKSKKKV